MPAATAEAAAVAEAAAAETAAAAAVAETAAGAALGALAVVAAAADLRAVQLPARVQPQGASATESAARSLAAAIAADGAAAATVARSRLGLRSSVSAHLSTAASPVAAVADITWGPDARTSNQGAAHGSCSVGGWADIRGGVRTWGGRGGCSRQVQAPGDPKGGGCGIAAERAAEAGAAGASGWESATRHDRVETVRQRQADVGHNHQCVRGDRPRWLRHS